MKSTLSKPPGEDYYIVMTDEQGEIHIAPDHASPIVAHAYLGDVFYVRGMQNQPIPQPTLHTAARYWLFLFW